MKIYKFTPPGDITQYAIQYGPDDSPLLVIGDLTAVGMVVSALENLIVTGKAHAEVHHLDPRFGYTWITTADAEALSQRIGDPVSARLIQRAVTAKQITPTEKKGKTIIFPQYAFLSWLKMRNRKRGRPGSPG